MRTTLLATTLLLASFLLTACLDIEPGFQLPGQECATTADCAEGLLCVERRCRPSGAGHVAPDAGHHDADENQIEVDADRPECSAGDADCLNDQTARFCRDGQWQTLSCPSSQRCLMGACYQAICAPGEAECLGPDARRFCNEVGQWVEVECAQDQGFSCRGGFCQLPNANCVDGEVECVDRGRGITCINGAWVDDLICPQGSSCNEDARACVPDPDPEPECCPDGCGANQICDGCQCVSYDPSICQYQDQPCTVEGQFSNGFSCFRYGETDSLRCYGICTTGAPDPDATCPGTDPALCLFEAGQPNGICASWCGPGRPCADSRQRCVYRDGGPYTGVCWPVTGTGQAGDACDPFDVFSCAGTALCIDGTCQDSCRPFYGGPTDCSSGNCLPFSEDLGVCAADSGAPGACTTQGTTCGGDATGCFPSTTGLGLQCYDFCRLSTGFADCGPGQVCFDFSGGEGELGVCF